LGCNSSCVLDIGGGSGICLQEILEINKDSFVVIVDKKWYGPDYLLKLPNVNWVKNIEDINIACQFDLVLCVNLFHCLRKSSLNNFFFFIEKALKKNGFLFIQDFICEPSSEYGCGVEYLLLGQLVNSGDVMDWNINKLPNMVERFGFKKVSEQHVLGGLSHKSKIWVFSKK